MDHIKKIEKDGISLRVIYMGLLILAVFASGLLLYATYNTSAAYNNLSEATDEYIELQKAAHELMDASDLLTESVQHFTAEGNTKYLDDYFTEAFEAKHREEAIQIFSQQADSESALRKLQLAMNDSLKLMEREYYAMKLVIEAQEIKVYPELLKDVQLTAKDKARPANEKMYLAQKMVLDDDYFDQKDLIRTNMHSSLKEIEEMTHTLQKSSSSDMKNNLHWVRILIVIQTVGVLIVIWLTGQLGINPILKAVENIREDNPIQVIGANEFRYLARTYNKMYDVYKASIERLNYKASHDELTQTYNRSGYELILTSIDMSSAYVIMLDGDHFKEINDNYGHDIGDKVIKKIAETVKRNFRSDDYICRIGGDEFVVFMVHTDKGHMQLVGSKIRQINKELSDTGDGVPATSVSAGIVHGSLSEDKQTLMHYADQALYKSKAKGPGQYTFYEEIH